MIYNTWLGGESGGGGGAGEGLQGRGVLYLLKLAPPPGPYHCVLSGGGTGGGDQGLVSAGLVRAPCTPLYTPGYLDPFSPVQAPDNSSSSKVGFLI